MVGGGVGGVDTQLLISEVEVASGMVWFFACRLELLSFCCHYVMKSKCWGHFS